MHFIDSQLRISLYFYSVTVINRKVTAKCYGYSACQMGHHIKEFIEGYLTERPNIRNLYMLVVLRDEIHHRFIREYLEGIK